MRLDDKSKEELTSLIVRERELYSVYVRICAHYQTKPDPVIQNAHQNRMLVMTSLLDGTLQLPNIPKEFQI